MKNIVLLIPNIVMITTLFSVSFLAQTGTLNGNVSESNPGLVDLTSVGSVDWVCWARAEGEVDQKKDVEPLITMELISVSNDPNGEPATNLFYGDETGNTFSWTDGTPTESGTDIDGGNWIPGVGNGYRITVPAGTNPQTLILYLGVWMADCKLVASLSDESTDDYEYINSFTEEADDGHVRAFTISFQAGADEEFLTVEWTSTANNDEAFGGWGNVTLRGAALAGGIVDVNDFETRIPLDYQLDQNYPNPFNPSTLINFGLPANDFVKLDIYDLTGRIVKTLVNNRLNAGVHSVTWNGQNDQGQIVSSGVYIYKLKTDKFFAARKMMFMK